MIPDREKIFFVDEYGIQVNSRTNYGRSRKGERANKRVKCVRGKNYSVCAAMNCKSLFFFEVKDTPYNGEDLHVFLEQLFTYFDSNQIERAYVVMDNVNFDKTERVRELFSSKSHHQVLMPPYSPMLNPIENLSHNGKIQSRELNVKMRMSSMQPFLIPQHIFLSRTVQTIFATWKNILSRVY